VYALRQGVDFAIEPVSPARAIARLVAATVLPAATPMVRASILDSCAALVTAHPVRELTFRIDDEIWGWLDERGG
jgi:hypothetical protein